jgi:hypothetical protein
MANEKPPSSLTQIPTAALPKFGFELKEALALERVQKSPGAAERREMEETPARNQMEFARFLAETGKINEGDTPSPGNLPPSPKSGRER